MSGRVFVRGYFIRGDLVRLQYAKVSVARTWHAELDEERCVQSHPVVSNSCLIIVSHALRNYTNRKY